MLRFALALAFCWDFMRFICLFDLLVVRWILEMPRLKFLLVLVFFVLGFLNSAEGLLRNSRIRGVNLGGWLVIEGWIKPSFFHDIPNGDILDGTEIQLKSVTLKKYVSAENGGGATVTIDRDTPQSWETFQQLWRSSGDEDNITAVAQLPSGTETFYLERNNDNRINTGEQISIQFIWHLSDTECSNASVSRDGFTGWATPEYISKTLEVIDFLASRYAKHPALLGIELLNESSAATVPLDILVSFYKQGYQIVPKYTSTAYVIFRQRISNADPYELYQANLGRVNAVIDLHYYNLFDTLFANMSSLDNVQFLYKNRQTQMQALNDTNGPLVFIGCFIILTISQALQIFFSSLYHVNFQTS
ncbi:glucan 1,3-beta-glucosidase-like [Primulina eburnea]|uniref:glucan 1,3-beta-glucosidase-like n=1 Tax=Primulina eburnea TaxID=1245227 RepID=UPI003C6C67C2